MNWGLPLEIKYLTLAIIPSVISFDQSTTVFIRCILLPRNSFNLGFDVAKQVVHIDGTILLYNILILDSFEHKIGKESVSGYRFID